MQEGTTRRSVRGISLRRVPQQAGGCGRAEPNSFGFLFWPVNIRPKNMSGNPGDALKGKHAWGWYFLPAIKRRVFDAQACGQSNNSTRFCGTLLNNIYHVAKSRLNLHLLSSELVGAKW